MKAKDVKKLLNIKISKEDFIREVITIVREDDIKYSEAILEVCKNYDLEPEDVVPLITGNLKERIKYEAMDYHVIKDTRGNKLFGM